jgi:hypothetical protein
VPAALRRAAALQSLWLDHTVRLGPLPAWLGERSWVALSLADNPLDPGPVPVLRLDRLFLLDLGNTHRTGNLPLWLAGGTKLTYLLLDRNQLAGEIPAAWGNLTGLSLLSLRSNRLSGTVPAALAGLANLQGAGSLDLRWNALRQSDRAIVEQLNLLQAGGADFRDTQTVTPRGLRATTRGPETVQLAWNPIRYRADGYYAVFKATSLGGPYTLAGRTASKDEAGLVVTGLEPRTLYWFVVRSVTEPHADNANRLVSPPTPPVSARTFP